MSSIRGHVSESGRLSLPAQFRRAVGLDHGGDVVVELVGKEIRIRTLEEVVAQSQALVRRLLKGKPGTDVDAFLAERREEAARE